MVADTNVLVRLIVNDDPEQAKRALALLESFNLVVLDTVVLEVEWVLRSLYKKSRAEIVESFRNLLRQENVRAPQLGQLKLAVSDYEKGFDFADALHYRGASGLEVKTFDRKFVNRGKREGWRVSLV